MVDRRPPTTTTAVSNTEALSRRVQAVTGRDLSGRTEGLDAAGPWLGLGDAPRARARAYKRPPCPWEEHRFRRFMAGDVVVLILCEECGREPIEALGQLVTGPS